MTTGGALVLQALSLCTDGEALCAGHRSFWKVRPLLSCPPPASSLCDSGPQTMGGVQKGRNGFSHFYLISDFMLKDILGESLGLGSELVEELMFEMGLVG